MICPHCHTDNREGAKFCDECGARLPQGDPVGLPAHVNAKLADLPVVSVTGFGMGEGCEADDGRDAAAAPSGLDAASAPQEPGDVDPACAEDEAADPDASEQVAAEQAAVEEAAVEEVAGEEDPEVAAGQDGADDAEEPVAGEADGQAVAEQAEVAAEPGDAQGVAGDPEATGRIELPAIGAQAAPAAADEDSLACDRTHAFDASEISRIEFETGKTQNLGPRPASPELSTTSGADLSGFDEFLVYPGYMPPKAAWHAGDTMEMPAITDADIARRTEFIAPDNDKKARRKKGKRSEKKQDGALQAAHDAKAASDDAKPIAASKAKRSGDSAKSVSAPAQGSGKGKLVAAAIAIIVTLGAFGAAVATYQMELWGGKIVPDVTGMTQADATYLLQNKGFTVSATTVPSDATEGMVLLMDPGAGARQDEGSEVVIHVSVSRTVPNIVGASQDAALSALADAGFENVLVQTILSDDAEGTVLDVEPAEGAKAKANTPVTVTVAQPYTVPDVSGMTPRQAAAAIEEAGLSSTMVYAYDDSVTEGSLLGVEPGIGSKVTSDTVVTISVARSRANELTTAARSYLSSAALQASDGSSFTVSSVDSVSYQGSNTVAFTASGRASTSVTVLGQTLSVSGDSKQVTGTIVFDNSNNVTSVSFS